MRKPLSPHFRKLSIAQKREHLQQKNWISHEEAAHLSGAIDLSEPTDLMIETAIGLFPLPLGLATGFLIDGEEIAVPLATEESSVIAAASFAARLVKGGGGFQTEADDPLITAQIYLHHTAPDARKNILFEKEHLHRIVDSLIPNMVKRGGGCRGVDVEMLPLKQMVSVSVHIDVRDAMGANVANTVAEGLKGTLQSLSGGEVLMSILTNAFEKRKARAAFQVPEKYFGKGAVSGRDVCLKIVQASRLAEMYPKRAVTHNKGIMNGITALALATGNDTRAVEAAAHFHAAQDGSYQSLTKFRLEGHQLKGSIEVPLPLGTQGGAITFWPGAKVALNLLGRPNSKRLCCIAAALGLAQNLAAVFALVTEGIQKGHMKLHAEKIAYVAGARGSQISILAAKLNEMGAYQVELAKKIFEEM